MTGRPPARPAVVELVELVELLDNAGQVIGTAPKATVHTADTPLHRAFSCYLFDPQGRLLVTRRAASKRTFPGLWTNSVCGHPAPGENDRAAIRRRAGDELGVSVQDITVALPDFRYTATSDGITEHEICPVYLARTVDEPHPDPTETGAWAWLEWRHFLARMDAAPGEFSPWSRWQAQQLMSGELLRAYRSGITAPAPAEPPGDRGRPAGSSEPVPPDDGPVGARGHTRG